jgi:hypothetical protein
MLALASVTHLLWFLRHLLKSLPIVVGFQLEFLLIGIAVSSWLKPWVPPRSCLPEIGLVGLAFAIFYSQIWSLFGGLHPGSNGILVLITLVSLLSRYRTTISFLREAWNYTNVALLIALLPVLLVAAWNALTSSLTCYDIQGYHLQAVRWAAEFGSVPGLANLHGRLGFNSALDPLAALLSSPGGLWLGREYVNGAIVIITLAVLLQGTAGSGTRTIYALLLLPFPVSLLFSNCLSSPQPDVAADSSAVLFAWYLRDTVLGNESEASSALFPVFLTGALALVFKISNAAFAATGVCLAWSAGAGRDAQYVN